MADLRHVFFHDYVGKNCQQLVHETVLESIRNAIRNKRHACSFGAYSRRTKRLLSRGNIYENIFSFPFSFQLYPGLYRGCIFYFNVTRDKASYTLPIVAERIENSRRYLGTFFSFFLNVNLQDRVSISSKYIFSIVRKVVTIFFKLHMFSFPFIF